MFCGATQATKTGATCHMMSIITSGTKSGAWAECLRQFSWKRRDAMVLDRPLTAGTQPIPALILPESPESGQKSAILNW